MRSTAKAIFICLIFMVFSDAAYSSTVERVYACGNDIGIKTNDDGWLVVRQSSVGSEAVNRILSIALSLLATQKQISYYNNVSTNTWCGIQNTKEITAFGINAN